MEMDWKIRGGHKQATREGYNLFQTIGNTANTSQGLTITTDDDGVVTINGTANVAYAEIVKNKEITDKLMDGETYTIWQSTVSQYCYMQILAIDFNNVQTYITNNNTNITTFVVNKTKYAKYLINVTGGQNATSYTFNNFKIAFMLLKGSYTANTVPPYEAYGVSPSLDYPSEIETVKDSVEMNKSNKNIFDIDTMIELTNQYREYLRKGKIQNLNNFNGLKIPVEPGHEYILSTDSTLANNLCFFDKNMNFLGGYADNRNFVAPENCRYVTYAIQNDYTWIQFEENSEKTPYVEHKGQAYIMPVQQEMLDGDYINDVEYHGWKKLILDGENYGAKYVFPNGYFKLIDLNNAAEIKDAKKTKDWAVTEKDAVFCTHLNSSNLYAISVLNSKGISNVYDGGLVLKLDDATKETNTWTRETINAYLKQQYEAGNPIVIYYKLAKPIDLELTEEQKAIREQKLHTYKNVTNISLSNELASIDVTYKKDLETEHNKLQEKNNNLQSQIDEIKQLLSTTETSAMLINNLQKDVEMEVK